MEIVFSRQPTLTEATYNWVLGGWFTMEEEIAIKQQIIAMLMGWA